MDINLRDKELLIAIPTYNEASNVEAIYKSLKDISNNSDFLFIDDNSPDGTADLIKKICLQDSKVYLLSRPKKLGVGGAHFDAINWAYQNNYKNLLTLDADFTHTSSAVIDILKNISHNKGVVIGTRFKNKNSLPGWTLYRKFMTHFGHFLTSFFLKISYDATGALRLYNLENINLEIFKLIPSKGYAFFPESLFALNNNGLPITEIPVVLPSRTYGNSKMTFGEVLKTVKTLGDISLKNWLYPNTYYYVPESKIKNIKDSHPNDWDEYWNQKKSTKKLIFDIVAKITRKLLIEPRLTKVIKDNFLEGSKLLHIGCGSGEVDINIISDYNITSLDYSKSALLRYYSLHKSDSNCVLGSAFSLPFEENTFNGVYHLGLYEHYSDEDLKKMLTEIHRVLIPGGKIIVFWPPEFGSSVLFFKIFHLFKNKKERESELYPDEINRIKNYASVENLFTFCNFKVEDISMSALDLFLQVKIVATKAI